LASQAPEREDVNIQDRQAPIKLVPVRCPATFSQGFEFTPVHQEAEPAPIVARAYVHRTDGFADIEGDSEIPIRLGHLGAVKSTHQKKRAAVKPLDVVPNRLPVN
jgi:hypothetical protein